MTMLFSVGACQPKIPLDSHEFRNTEVLCQARATVHLQHNGVEEHAQSSISYSRAHGASRLEWIFFSPVGTRVGRLILDESGDSFWQDPGGRRDVFDREALWARWVTPNWPADVEHLLGLESPLSSSERELFHCPKDSPLRACIFKEQFVQLKVDFSFLSCE